MARVSQLPLAESHQLLTVPCISDPSCQQLVRPATAPAAWLAAAKYESATVVQTATSQASGLPPRQGMSVQPSGRFPFL